jgi:putative Holliday junction resolvase
LVGARHEPGTRLSRSPPTECDCRITVVRKFTPEVCAHLRGAWDGCRAAGRADSPMLVALAAPGCSSTARRALCAVMALAATPPQPGGVGTRTLGVDFGLRRVGLALSGGFAPLPLNVLPCDDDDAANDFQDIARRSARVAVGEGASQIVLGMPLNAAGEEGEQANVTRTFASTLALAAAPLPVFLWDERFSTAEARLRMTAYASTAGALDAVAATVILENFFAAPAEVRIAAEQVPLTEAQQSAFDTARAAAQSAAAARPPPLSASEVRRRMLEEVAQQNLGGQGSPKRKQKRGKGK